MLCIARLRRICYNKAILWIRMLGEHVDEEGSDCYGLDWFGTRTGR